MAYNKTNWSDRQVQRPLTFNMVTNADGTITLQPAEGSIIQSGTPITAANLNNLETQYDQVVAWVQSFGLGLGNFSLDSNGIMTVPKQSYAFAYRGNAAVPISSGVATKVAFDGTWLDRQGEFVNNVFTPKQGGLYLIITQSQWSTAPTGDTYHYLYRNGSNAVASIVGAGQKYPSIAIIFSANAGDALEFYVLQNSGGAAQTLIGFNAAIMKLA